MAQIRENEKCAFSEQKRRHTELSTTCHEDRHVDDNVCVKHNLSRRPSRRQQRMCKVSIGYAV